MVATKNLGVFCVFRNILEDLGIWDEGRRLQATPGGVAIPVKEGAQGVLHSLLSETGETNAKLSAISNPGNTEQLVLNGIEMKLVAITLPESKKVK